MRDPHAAPMAAAVPREDDSRGRLLRIAVGLYIASFVLTLPSAAAMLLVPDPETGLAFFARHFGWERGDAMPMGDQGDYRFIDHGGRTIGATMPNMQGGPRLRFYFGVPDIGAAERAVRDNGGSVLVSPVEIPGGEYVMVAADPDGASFGMVGPKGAT